MAFSMIAEIKRDLTPARMGETLRARARSTSSLRKPGADRQRFHPRALRRPVGKTLEPADA